MVFNNLSKDKCAPLIRPRVVGDDKQVFVRCEFFLYDKCFCINGKFFMCVAFILFLKDLLLPSNNYFQKKSSLYLFLNFILSKRCMDKTIYIDNGHNDIAMSPANESFN